MEHDYSVTWNQVKNLVNVMIEDHDEKVAMADINRAVNQAWNVLYDALHEKYGGLEIKRQFNEVTSLPES